MAAVAGESGTRNDGAAPTQTATIQVQRAPCGRWRHKSWKAGTLEWRTDSNSDPEPIQPSDAIETVQWVDECATTTKPDEERSVPYTLVGDAPVEVEGVWHRKAEYRAYSTCAGAAIFRTDLDGALRVECSRESCQVSASRQAGE